MPINPSSMRPVEVGRLINSTTAGFVISQARVYRDFNRVGFRIAASDNSRNINLLKYIAWLCDEKHTEPVEQPSQARSYDERRDAERARNAAQSLAGRDIGDMPEVQNPQRKADCERNFRLFSESYFPDTFTLAWSDDHLKVIDKIETAVLAGGLFALALPRGSGKTSLVECACLWAMLYGHREFVTLIGATETAALELLDSLKTELEVNENLAADFPEVCFPIASLDGIANRCAGQLYGGERTRITWTSSEIVLPTVKNSKASGIIVRVAGITGRVRGMKYKRSDGRSVRPSLVIIDDPQTSESAGSLEQTRKRVRVLAGDILGLAGPGQKISGIMPCTVIRPGDLADTILNRTTHPDWNGERTKMLYQFPKNMKLWEEYAEIRAEALRTDGNFQAATDFYLANREAMDEGAVVEWEARFNPDEVSALQHAMNLKLQDEIAFQSEYQNDPLPEDVSDDSLMSVDEIAEKVNGLARGRVPLACDKLTMFIDVQKALLYYVVIAWSEDFSGTVIDYGAWPDQHRRQFSLSDANPTIQSTFPKAGFEGGLYAALQALTDDYLAREWEREDGALLKIERAMIDANWGQSTDLIYQFCRQSIYSGVILPAHGRYVGASSKPMTEYKKQQGDKLGFNWMMPSVKGKRAIRHVIFDSNFWKSFIHARLAVPMGDKSCLALYGRHPQIHQLIAEHLTAEYRVKTIGRGRTVDEWKLRPERSDNHWLDCCAGCAVCASMLGATLPEFGAVRVRTRNRPPLRLSEQRTGKTPHSAPVEGVSSLVPKTAPKAKLKLSELRKRS
ncbi:terminase gpA endonuclease subunit [Victivallis sp. Marseille-Q1083]|uniref:terminase gpA endonuclease subunit n=1 Tax=Victivallis sp. Marseille-Q1083 TaxID=2717288 RepID=UPI00158AA54E|nr:terminase gpA endonuclease subunit [Victivallis sp. Marseille-Q1083]